MSRRASPTLTTAAFLFGVCMSPVVFGAGTANAELESVPCATEQAVGQQGAQTASDTAVRSPAAVDVPVTPPAGTDAAVLPHARFNEVLPDPEGADDQNEFIEIANPDDADADLAGWKIENSAGKTFAITAHLGPKALYAFPYAETKIALVNAGMTLTLRDPSGNAADTLTYAGPAKAGKSFARADDGTWRWTSTPTPGAGNVFDLPVQEIAASSAAGETATAPQTAPVVATVTETANGAGSAPAAPSPSEDSAQFVSIAEIMPNPQGDDAGEWVALKNDGQAEARLDGWSLDDAEGGSAPFSLAGIRIPAQSRVRVARADSKIALNNDGDSARLIGPDGVPRQVVSFGIAPEGKTFANIDGTWRWTPEDAGADDGADASGVVASAFPTEVLPTDGERAADAAELPAQASVSDLSPDDDSLLEIEGVITLPPGVVGKRTFAMQDPSGLGGVFVRAYGTAALPPLAAGDRVRVIGRAAKELPSRFSTTGGRIRKVAAGKIAFDERTPAEIGDDAAGMAVAVPGIVTRRSGSLLRIADARGQTEIAVRAVAGRTFATTFTEGATVVARGVIRLRAGTIELLVTEKDGVVAIAHPAAEPQTGTAPSAVKKILPETQTEPRKPLTFGYAAEKAASSAAEGAAIAAALAAAAAIVLLVRRRRSAEPERLAADR